MKKSALTTLAVLSMGATAYASTEGVVNTDVLNVRTGPGTSYGLLGQVKRGTKLDLLSKSGEWYKIKLNGKDGWVNGTYLKVTTTNTNTDSSTSNSTSSTNATKAKTTENLNMRSGEGTSYRIIKTLPKGTEIDVISVKGDWAKMKYDGRLGYVNKAYITYISTSTSTTDDLKVISVKEVNVASNDTLNVRSGPSTKYSTLGSLKKGDKVEVVGIENGWSKIKYKNSVGYVSDYYLKVVSTTPSTPTPTPTPSTPSTDNALTVISVKEVNVASNDTLNVRSGPSTKNTVLGALKKGDKVEVLSIENGWSKIKYKDSVGYVSDYYLKAVSTTTPSTPTPTPTPTPSTPSKDEEKDVIQVIGKKTAITAVNVRSGAGTTYTSLGVLAYNETVEVISESNGWSKIKYKNGIGYVATSYLSAFIGGTSNDNNGSTVEDDTIKGNIVEANLNYALSDHVAKQLERVAVGGNVISASKPRMGIEVASSGFVPAEEDDLEYFLNPANFVNTKRGMQQFLRLDKYREGITASELNAYLNGLPKVNGQNTVFYNQGQTFIDAAKRNNIDVSYLVAHAMWETGYGTSTLSKGQTITTYKGQALEKPVTVYNFFGIGAIDKSANLSGGEAAYSNGWTSIEATINGSADWIASNYIHSTKYNQNTIYKMKFNYDYTWHQYATDVNWANGISGIMNTLNNLYENQSSLTYEVPKYK